MKVLSLFDGMSCGRVALNRAGIDITSYVASEIDKYAITVAQKNYPDTIQMGCVKFVRCLVEADALGDFDMLIGGSPCQGFSFAGKQLAFDDPRSALFFDFVAILNHLKSKNPNLKFLLENVKMKKNHLQVITDMVGVEPVLINSALVSAQSRQRYYWCNWSVSQPADRGLILRDIIESGDVDREKSYCIDANYYKGGSVENYMKKARRQNHLSPCSLANVNPSSRGMNGQVFDIGFKSPTLTTNKGEGVKIRQSELPLMVGENLTYRKLTPVECERLQGLPDGYTEGVSNTQRYKMLGNGWQVDTIEHILREMK